jgi:8-oxo-dGTP diphosphatase
MHRRDSAFAIILRRQRVLLVQPWLKRKWQLPGGSIESGETPWKAALREVKEETGMGARIAGLTGIYARADGSLAFVFAARVGLGEHPRGPRHEIRKQKWFPADQALRRLSASAAERLRDALGHPRVFRRRAARVVGPRTLKVSAG